jgi:hypothetical protein
VSEYQYYDFRAIDRALTKAEMADYDPSPRVV